MKSLLTLTLISLLCASLVTAQKAKKAKPDTSPRTIAKDAPVPDGFVIVAETATNKTVTKPGDQEIICDSSPVPANYTVAEMVKSEPCPAGGNPLRNALLIRRDGVSAAASSAPAPAAPKYSPPARRWRSASESRSEDEDEDDLLPRTDPSDRRDSTPAQPRPSTQAIDDAARQHRVIVGMEYPDVFRAWGRPMNKGTSASEFGQLDIWYYRNARVYFADGRVYQVSLIQ